MLSCYGLVCHLFLEDCNSGAWLCGNGVFALGRNCLHHRCGSLWVWQKMQIYAFCFSSFLRDRLAFAVFLHILLRDLMGSDPYGNLMALCATNVAHPYRRCVSARGFNVIEPAVCSILVRIIKTKKAELMLCLFRFGDPYGNRTHVPSVRG